MKRNKTCEDVQVLSDLKLENGRETYRESKLRYSLILCRSRCFRERIILILGKGIRAVLAKQVRRSVLRMVQINIGFWGSHRSRNTKLIRFVEFASYFLLL